MRTRYCTAVLLLLGVLLGGCSSVLHPWGSPRTMDGSYDQVFQAALEVLEAREFPIKRADRETGEIETGKRPVDGLEPSHPVETVQARVKSN